jgi:hypothetical protein
MNNSLARLFEGVIATLRADVIPRIEDGYARGQAVGVIDILNGLSLNVDWSVDHLTATVEAQEAAIARVRSLVADLPAPPSGAGEGATVVARLEARRDANDRHIGGLWPLLDARAGAPGVAEAASVLKAYMHDELKREMKRTPKPLFGEIAKGNAAAAKD